MNKSFFLTVGYLLLATCAHGQPVFSAPSPQKPKETLIAFGSCSKQWENNLLWDEVLALQPEIWVWLGDIVYAEKTRNLDSLKDMYQQQRRYPAYRALEKEAHVTGIWDDHDYGLNDGGRENPIKNEAKEVLLNFLGVPQDHPVRKHKGIYRSEDHWFQDSTLHINLLLLDTRFFRDPLQKDPSGKGLYLPNTTGTLLGEAQWEWLETELNTSDADFTILCSGYQVLSDQHRYEKWSNFPHERERLFDTIAQSGVENVILLSGDRHFSEFSTIRLPGMKSPIWEFTASGMTHTGTRAEEPNPYRVGERVFEKNMGTLRFTPLEQKENTAWEVDFEVWADSQKRIKWQEVIFKN